MNGSVFLDTNILLYIFSVDEAEKQKRSREIIESERCCVSVQTLNEFCNVCLKKHNLDKPAVEKAIDHILAWCNVNHITVRTLRTALALHEKYGYSYYDCVMLASALDHGCKHFISEDMSDGQVIEGCLTITNPFK